MQTGIKESGIMVLKGALISLIVALVGVLIFSGVVKLAYLSANVIKPVNQFIKILALFLGCFFSVRGKMGYLKGGLVGVLATVLIFLTFSIIGGELSFGIPFLIDLLLGVIVGAISGIITVNVKK